MDVDSLELLPFHAGCVELVARKLGLGQCRIPVVLRQHLGIVIGNLDGMTFEEAVAKWEKIFNLGRLPCQRIFRSWTCGYDIVRIKAYLSLLLVLADDNALDTFLRSNGGNVDEQTCLDIDPPAIDDVQFIFETAISIFRIYLQHIIAFLVSMDGHIIVGSQIVDGGDAHLDINVRVPWHDLPNDRQISTTSCKSGWCSRVFDLRVEYLSIPPPSQ